jgi:putative membrane protein
VTSPPPGTRTGLAWQRTGLGLIAIAGLIEARAFNTGATSLVVIAGAAGLLGAGVLGVVTPLRLRMLRRQSAAGDDVAAPGAVAFVTVAVVLLGVLAGVAVLAVPGR